MVVEIGRLTAPTLGCVRTTPPPPPLTLWGETWRYALITLIGAMIVVARYAELPSYPDWLLVVDILVGLASLVALHWRRRYPMTIALVLTAVSVPCISVAGPSLLAFVSVATRRRWREIIPLSLATIAAGLVVSEFDPALRDPLLVSLASNVGLTALVVVWGMYVGSRRELLRTLVDRAETAESEQAARVAQARTAERARIAREMHDVLAHRISMVSLHAGALAYRTDLSPEEIRRSAEIIQSSSHEALVELREVLGVLRDDSGDAAPELPQPSARDIATLIAEARATGMVIDESIKADLDALPVGTGRTAYRVIQESLTNARKHAPHTAVFVGVHGSPGTGIDMAISNPLPLGGTQNGTPGAGLGLVGLAERVHLAGGEFGHRLTPDGRFEIHARLPWPA
ncbi:two-component sensor histidine kinase [Aeromicrobium camelliae]|uniref:histidine kinase n=1 Tax=Aeromicrobium camelliae TaxID=1538144 RepID=A0A3N6X266_9ACTN|nr:two-component sensor histidine kinase [Aeromicrobium camelliae]